MANRKYVMLEDKNGEEVLPVTDGNGVFVEGGTKKLDKKLTEINEQLDTIANKGTTVEVLERVTKEEIERQIQDGTIANLTLADESITLEKLNASIFGVAYILQGVEKTWLSYEFIKLSQKYSNCKLRVKFDYTPNNDTFFRIATNKYNGEVTSKIFNVMGSLVI